MALRLEDLLTHERFVRSVARAIVGNDPDADDVTQDVWLKAAQAPPADARSPRAWLFTVIRNVARSRARGDRRRAQRERITHEENAPTDPKEILAREEVRREVLDAVLGLDDPYRTAVLLRYLHELPIADVAERTGVPTNTAAARVHRARAMLRERLHARDEAVEIDLRRGVLLLAGPRIPESTLTLGALLMLKPLLAVLVLIAAIASWALLMDPPDGTSTAPPARTHAAEAADDPSETISEAIDGEVHASRVDRRNPVEGDAVGAPLEPGPRVTGQVVTPLGAPIEGARVTRMSAPGGPPPLSVETNERGQFALPLGAGGIAKLSVTAEAFVAVQRSVTEGDIGALILRPGYPIQWTVVDDETGAPLPHAYASFRAGEGATNRMIRADDEGTFITTAPRIADYLQIRAEGYVPWSAEPLLGAGAATRVIRLPRETTATTVRLRVTDRMTGQPVPGVTVGGAAPGDAGGGVLEIAAFPSFLHFNLQIEAPGYVPANLRIPIAEAAASTPTALELTPSTTLHFRINAPDGSPVSKAQIVLIEQERPSDLGPWRLLASYTTATDDFGAATIAGLAPGLQYRAVASHSHWNAATVERILIEDRREQVLDPIPLAPPVALLGRVTDERTLAPIADAEITMATSTRYVRTDAEGRFAYRPAVIGGAVTATAAGYVSKTISETPDPRAPHEVTIALARGETISGVVLDPEGVPAAGIRVEATRYKASFETTTSLDGTFVLLGLSSGEPFELRAWDGAMSAKIPNIREPDRRIVVGETDVRLQLSAPSGIRVRVVREDDGTPVRKFEVATMWRPDGARDPDRNWGGVNQTKSDADGVAFIAVDAGERVDITIRGAGLGEVAFPDQVVAPGEIRDLTAKLSAPSVVEGHITRRDGRPATGIVQLVRAGVENHWHFEATTDEQGHFRIEGVSTGDYEIAFTARTTGRDGAAHTQLVDLSPARVRVIPGSSFLELGVAESPANSISGRIVLPPNAMPADRIELWLRPDREPRTLGVNEALSVTLGPDCLFRFEGVQPGRYATHIESDVSGSTRLLVGTPYWITVPVTGDLEIAVEVPGFPVDDMR